MNKLNKIILKTNLKRAEGIEDNILVDYYIPLSEGESLLDQQQSFIENEEYYEITTKVKVKKKEEMCRPKWINKIVDKVLDKDIEAYEIINYIIDKTVELEKNNYKKENMTIYLGEDIKDKLVYHFSQVENILRRENLSYKSVKEVFKLKEELKDIDYIYGIKVSPFLAGDRIVRITTCS